MLATRNIDERGVANFGWLNSRHTFSCGGQRDMEITSYVISGERKWRTS